MLPAVIMFGLGLSATVASVRSAALSAATAAPTSRQASTSAVARTAQVLAVAVGPWIAGLSGAEIHRQDAWASGFPRAMLAMAGVAFIGAYWRGFTLNDGPLARTEDAAG